jgi:hypothetical protein
LTHGNDGHVSTTCQGSEEKDIPTNASFLPC